ncbi:SpoIIE family protein phosphatase [Streptomyces erythrochromogenes]|uniref:SpoIIE family protein phosphatase n=1 Tax=Streptomyces erythrochromogenes TaxID=285574 RepID=UPI00225BCE54|nr:SpoIIE family protein phosphatase [Streptomyces erythrochromogenes]MCX5583333.1 SpoIIE family protein phosphatase [Streptomyces erythrochromogenes]
MNRFARLATRLLAVPLGLVWLEPAGEAAGAAPECWPVGAESDPAVPACCRLVAEDGMPRFLSHVGDGSDDGDGYDGGASFAFAGVPLVGGSGELLGVLAVTDRAPRKWSEDDVRDLSDLAAACSAQMRMRTRSETVRQAREAAEGEATRVHGLLNRSELLLRASEDLADTSGLDDVRRRVGDLVGGDLKPAGIDLVLVRQGMLHHVTGPVDDDVFGPPPGRLAEPFGLGSHWPVARAVREHRLIVVDGPSVAGGTDAAPGHPATPAFDGLHLATAACLPLRGTHDTLGALVLGWDAPYEIGVDERAVLTTLAGYTAQAVERALHLDERVTVARQLQRAMLTELPDVPGLELSALYRPAARDDMVGGDWYDAYPLPVAPGGAATGALSLTVGDITGHDMRAAALMGQVRSMLRQADHDHAGEGPDQALCALERACRRLNLPASGTAVHAHLTPAADGHWRLRWSNAGHPAPLVVTADGAVETLARHDVLLHHALTPGPRTCDSRSLPPGSTLLLYTDGLVEERGGDIEDNVDRLSQQLTTAPPGVPLDALLRSLLGSVGPRDARDDAVLFAVRVAAS